jgi:hypothetical protein
MGGSKYVEVKRKRKRERERERQKTWLLRKLSYKVLYKSFQYVYC